MNRELWMSFGALIGESGVSFAIGPENDPWCVSPTGSVTRLELPSGAEGGRAMAETGGLVFGRVAYPDPDSSPGAHGSIHEP